MKTQKKKKAKLMKSQEDDPVDLPLPPWNLSKEQIKEADRRATTIQYPEEVNISPGPHFTKPWTLKTMNCKLQVSRINCTKVDDVDILNSYFCLCCMIIKKQNHLVCSNCTIIKLKYPYLC